MGGVRLWFHVASPAVPHERLDPFIPAALLAAMASGEPVEVSASTPVSPRLLAGIEQAQQVLHAWNPELKRVAVQARAAPHPPPRQGSAAFFSGGVDGSFTFLRHRAEIGHLLLLHGLEVTLDNETLFQQALTSATRFAEQTEKTLVPVRTNLRDLADAHHLSNHLFQGAILSGAALCVGFAKTYIAASRTYDRLMPWGTHPLLDPLWSTETCALIHDGADASRSEKIAAISQFEPARQVLRVCLENTDRYNCGRCEKCLRTMTALRLLGVSVPTLPALDAGQLRRVSIDPEVMSGLLENLDLARRVGDRPVERALRGLLRRHRHRVLLKEIDDVLLGGRLRRLSRLVRRPSPGPARIGCLPQDR